MSSSGAVRVVGSVLVRNEDVHLERAIRIRSAEVQRLDELGRANPRSYGLSNMARRLAQKSDPWRDLH